MATLARKLGLLLGLGIVGCGGTNKTAPDATSGDPDATVECKKTDKVDLDGYPVKPEILLANCQAGALAGFDPSGIWYLRGDINSPWDHSSTRLDYTCQEGLIVAGTSHRAINDDYLFWTYTYKDMNYAYQSAGFSCGLNEQENMLVKAARCFQFGTDDWQCEHSEREAMRLTRQAGEGLSSNIAKIGSYEAKWTTRFIANVRVLGDYAFMAAGNEGLKVIDISNESSPDEVAELTLLNEFINDLKIVDDPNGTPYALLAGNEGVYVVDISDPLNPDWIDRIDLNDGVHTLYTETLNGVTKAYLADGQTARLRVLDVSNPAAAIDLGVFNYGSQTSGTTLHDLFIENGRAYLNAGDSFVVADIASNPADSTILGEWIGPQPMYSHSSWVTEAGGRKIAVHGGEGYGAHIHIIDVDPDSAEFMQPIGTYKTRDIVSAHNVMAVGNKAYIAYYQDGVRVLDLSDPTNPTEIGYYNTWDEKTAAGSWLEGAAGIDLDMANQRIYVADYPRGLFILEDQTN